MSQREHYVFIDVSLPEGTLAWVSAFSRLHQPSRALCRGVLIGTTGFESSELSRLEALSSQVAWCQVSNFSAGVHLFEEILRATTANGASVSQLARDLGFDLALWESHHTRKLDAPSGTAKTLATAAGIDVATIASTRVGQVVGEHVVFASAEGEELRLQHIAHTRVLFARGAVMMAEKLALAGLPYGRYSKADILNLPSAPKVTLQTPPSS